MTEALRSIDSAAGRVSNPPTRGEFLLAARVDDVPPGAVIETRVDGRMIALCNVGGEFFALDNRCPHRGGRLGRGELVGDKLVCPRHLFPFDVRTGACAFSSRRIATRYPVRVIEDFVYVALAPIDPSEAGATPTAL